MRSALIVSPDPNSDGGGVERFCHHLAGVLAADGWEVSMVGPTDPAPRWVRRLGGQPLWQARSAAQSAATYRPDLVVTNGFLGAARYPAATRVQVYHGTMVGAAINIRRGVPIRERVRKALGGGVAEHLSGHRSPTVAVSENAAAEVSRYYRRRVVAVIPNAVDTSIFHPFGRMEARRAFKFDSTSPVVLFAGRPEPRKGFDIALAASRRAGYTLAVAGPVVAGDGVLNLGLLSQRELALAYSAVDAVLLPTYYEACSYVVLEAMACGVPLLTTNTGYMSQILASLPQYGSLVAEPTPAAFTAALYRLHDRSTSETVTAARHWVAEHNSMDNFRKRWLDFLRSRVMPTGNESTS